ncbi:MarR family winged helix-turn-helix transcriptional regulator [Mycolicibacter virginiensis]|nr:MarR family transcriptional regulator [Mycolicibacter virginiensis]ULP47408.1 MarR family transcriptional regulator [Mycolicibacter virginiensis]
MPPFFVVIVGRVSVPSPAVEDTGGQAPAMRLPGLEDIEQNSWQEFVESSTNLLGALNRSLLGRHRLDLSELRLLDLLAKSDSGSVRMSELAAALMLLRSRVTWLTRRLESRGLVRRIPIPGDGRGVRAELTPEGRTRLGEARKTYAEQIRRLYVNQMSRQQMLALGASCHQISASLEAAELPKKSTLD